MLGIADLGQHVRVSAGLAPPRPRLALAVRLYVVHAVPSGERRGSRHVDIATATAASYGAEDDPLAALRNYFLLALFVTDKATTIAPEEPVFVADGFATLLTFQAGAGCREGSGNGGIVREVGANAGRQSRDRIAVLPPYLYRL